MEFSIEADESQANSALDRVRAKMTDVERTAIVAFQKATGAAESFARGVIRVAEVTGAIVVARRAWNELRDSVSGADRVQQRQVLTLENLSRSYTALRLSLSALAGTRVFLGNAAGFGAGLAIGELLQQTRQYGEELVRLSRTAAKVKIDLQDALAFDRAGTILGIDLTPLRGKMPIDEVRQYVEALREIRDPLEQARLAQDLFGDQADLAYQLLERRTEGAIDGARDLALTLNNDQRAAIESVRRALDGLSGGFGSLVSRFRQLREEARQTIVVDVALAIRTVARGVRGAANATPIPGGGIAGDPSAGGDLPFGLSEAPRRIPSLAEIVRGAVSGPGALPAGPGDVANVVGADPAARALAAEGRRAVEAVRSFESTVEGLQDKLGAARRRRDNLFALVQQGGENAALFGRDALGADAQVRALESLLQSIERQKQAREQVAQILLSAQEAELTGLDLIEAKRLQQIKQYGTERDLIRQINEAAAIRRQIESDTVTQKLNTAFVDGLQRSQQVNDQAFAEAEIRTFEFEQQTLELRQRTATEAANFELQVLQDSRAQQLRLAESFGGQDLQSRLALEQRKAAIEQDFLLRQFRLKADLLDRELQLEIRNMEIAARVRGVAEEDIARRRDALRQAGAERGKQLDATTQAAINTSRENAAIRSSQIIFDAQRQAYDNLRARVDSTFDALIASGRTAGERLKAAFLLPMLAIFKQLATEATTAFIAPILGVQRPGGAAAPQQRGGIFGQILGAGGAGLFGAGGQLPGPGGTPGFAGPVNLGGGATSIFGGAGGVAGGAAGIKGVGTNALGFLTNLGNLGRGVLGPGSTGGAQAGAGIGGAGGGALLLGGGILAFDGLRRGGLVGLGQATAGGALIGAKFGGPLGAAIGAGVGALAGTVRLFIKGAEERIVEKVKSAYGITIPRSFARDPLLALIKSQFGGNVDAGIRSAQVRDLIELYAMSTGQGTGGLGINRVTPIAIAQTGGQLFRQPTFSNGMAMSLDSISAGTPTSAPSGPVILQMDAEATTAFLQGQAVQTIQAQPRIVQGAVMSANRSNAGRRETAALQIQPGALLA